MIRNREFDLVSFSRCVALGSPDVGRTLEIPDSRVTALFTRGRAAEDCCEICAARRFYTGAARSGHSAGAGDFGPLLDITYVTRGANDEIETDPAVAGEWYERDAAPGDSGTAPLHQSLNAR